MSESIADLKAQLAAAEAAAKEAEAQAARARAEALRARLEAAGAAEGSAPEGTPPAPVENAAPDPGAGAAAAPGSASTGAGARGSGSGGGGSACSGVGCGVLHRRGWGALRGASLRGSGRFQPRPQRLRSGAGGLGLGLLRGGLSGGELCFQVGDALAHRVLPSSGRAVPRSILECARHSGPWWSSGGPTAVTVPRAAAVQGW